MMQLSGRWLSPCALVPTVAPTYLSLSVNLQMVFGTEFFLPYLFFPNSTRDRLF